MPDRLCFVGINVLSGQVYRCGGRIGGVCGYSTVSLSVTARRFYRTYFDRAIPASLHHQLPGISLNTV
jgi:hypothetical protein